MASYSRSGEYRGYGRRRHRRFLRRLRRKMPLQTVVGCIVAIAFAELILRHMVG